MILRTISVAVGVRTYVSELDRGGAIRVSTLVAGSPLSAPPTHELATRHLHYDKSS